jgi:hypothetical protein
MPKDRLRPFSLPAIGRKKLTEEIEVLIVHILLLAREMGVLKMSTVALDGGTRSTPMPASPGGDEAYSGRNRR